MFSRQQNKIIIYTAIGIIFILLASILYWQPFYGLMDDGDILQKIEEAKQNGYFRTLKEYILFDINSWGAIRINYLPIAFILYRLTENNSTLLFLLNAIFSIFSIALIGFAFFKAIFQEQLKKYFNLKINLSSFTALLLIFSFSVPWTHSFFWHPSLQEKLVFISGALTLLWLSSKKAQRINIFLFTILSSLFIFHGFATKGQFFAFVPAFLLCQLRYDSLHLNRNLLKYTKTLILLILCLIATLVVWAVSRDSMHTSNYNFKNIIPVWKSSLSIKLFLSVIIINLLSQYLIRERFSWNRPIHFLLFNTPNIVMGAFLALMSPWGLCCYLNSFLAPILSLQAIQVYCIFSLNVHFFKKLAIYGVLVFSISITIYQSYFGFYPLHSLRTIIYSQKLRELHNKQLFVPCIEGSERVAYYIKRYGKMDMQVTYIGTGSKSITNPKIIEKIKSKESYWLDSPKWCSFRHHPQLKQLLSNANTTRVTGTEGPLGMKILKISPTQ